jgi:catalase
MKMLATTITVIGMAFGELVLAQPVEKPADKAGTDKDLAQQIFDTMMQVHGVKQGFRPVHAKGIVCQGTFQATPEAAGLSQAVHFRGQSVPITVRFSDGAADPMIPDNSEHAGPWGMAIRFSAPGGESDIVAMSHNGFIVADGQQFLELQKAIAETDPSTPHPWPIEVFVSSHPAALKFVTENQIIPASFATRAFHGNDAFIFVNKDGMKQPGRYHIIPVAGSHDLSADEAKGKPADFLIDDLKLKLSSGPVPYRLIVQLPNDGDSTKDPTVVWPDDRKTIDCGLISVTSVVADSDAAQKALAFDPANLPDGIELSDDPLPALRSAVYALSAAKRQGQ